MRKLRLRRGFWIIIPVFLLSFFATPVKAETYTAYGATDFFFEFNEVSQFTVRTYAWESGIDSMLWLYNQSNQLVTSNDDYYGLDSRIDIVLEAGSYRLRTGVCCGNPDAWYGSSYRFETNINGQVISSTTTVVETTTTTTIPSSLGQPQNVVLSDTGESIVVEWDAATDDYGVSPERYAISWSSGNSGWGVSTGNVGDSTSLNTYINLPYQLFENTGGINAEYTITVRADNDTNSIYSLPSSPVILHIGHTPTPPTTTTTSTTTTTTTTTTSTTIVENLVIPETTTTTVATTTIPSTTTTTRPSTTTSSTTTTSTTTTLPTTTTTLPTTTTIPVDDIEEDIVDVLNNIDNLNTSSIVNAVSNLLSQGIDENEASLLASSPEVLSSITTDQAEEIFSKINIEELSVEEEKELAEALSEASDEIKNKFEEQVNVYSEGFDDYVPVGSSIDVGARRAIIAVTTVASSITIAAPSGGATGASSGGSGAGGDRSSNRSRRK